MVSFVSHVHLVLLRYCCRFLPYLSAKAQYSSHSLKMQSAAAAFPYIRLPASSWLFFLWFARRLRYQNPTHGNAPTV